MLQLSITIAILALYEVHFLFGERTASSDVLHLSSLTRVVELGFIFLRVMRQMWRWNFHLQEDALEGLFGTLPQGSQK